ncbi:hypothetical protein A4S06_08935 [Erysipelotrichaceae bacterium MTC7]|nr:hypothetical protein A4S06_08935 [Erysipelotrichaceae bacterium MTC7]
MEHSTKQLVEAKKQLSSLHHKTSEVVKTLEAKQEVNRYKSQITLAKRRVEAFEVALELIEKELNK